MATAKSIGAGLPIGQNVYNQPVLVPNAHIYSHPHLPRRLHQYPSSLPPSHTMSAPTSTSAHFDLEAQRPAPALTRTLVTSFSAIEPTDAVFGYTFDATPSAESRHDASRRQSLADVPPPYAEDAGIPLPAYTRIAPEPATLAMFLFKFGFRASSPLRSSSPHILTALPDLVFPPFWVFGAFILMSPLREPEAPAAAEGEEAVEVWMPEKTPAERAALIATLRAVEVKWARRCLIAAAVFVLLAAAAGLVAWGVLRH